jgi:C-terminal processing protease CtpA/Prc
MTMPFRRALLWRSIAIPAVAVVLASCGGGSDKPPTSADQFAAKCVTPRTGIDPATAQPYPDRQGTLDDEKKWLRAWTDDLYLWYDQVPAVDPSQYATAVAYFARLKAPQDRFHFSDNTAHWQQLSQSGVEAGYGVTWAILRPSPTQNVPRKVLAAYNEPGDLPANAQNVTRGVEVLTVDGADAVNGADQATVDKLNAGLFPQAANETHGFLVRNLDGTTRTITLKSTNVTSVSVQNPNAIDTPTGKVGYMLFNDHLATAEKGLVDAVGLLKDAGITDLVLDIRYNGGGYLAIASQLAYMIAAPVRTSGRTFEQIQFNNKHPLVDPVTGRTITPTPFLNQTLGFSLNAGASLPNLGLNRVFVLTGSGTCSASESVMNSLSGVDVQVIQIGSPTCGKPYGFYPTDNCGTTYFSIQFKGVNAKGFGDYADGFIPGGTAAGSLVGCQVADDFAHALGDVNEARLAAALSYRASATPSCPPAPPANALTTSSALRGEGQVFKSLWRTNRILLR